MARPMKDGLGPEAVQRLAASLARAEPSFDAPAFTRDCLRGLSDLELKQRVSHVIEALHRHLPTPFAATSKVLRNVVRQWDSGDPGDALRGFAAWPLIDYVGVHGVSDFERAMQTLRELTGLFTAEFAIRPFLDEDPERAFTIVHQWLNDDSAAVRRLCSEGLRPLLPWGKRVSCLSAHPERIIEVLDALAFDESEDVRRSVANNLNDISKSHPELVIRTCKRWLEGAKPGVEAQTRRLVQHATRTLVKAGHGGALALHGASAKARIAAEFSVAPKRLKLGGELMLKASITSTSPRTQRLVVDFVVHHQKANQQTRGKVFKWKELELRGKKSVSLSKRHPIRQITTRKYYSGVHVVELMVNGRPVAQAEFTLSVPTV